MIKKLLKKLRVKSKPLYRSGWNTSNQAIELISEYSSDSKSKEEDNRIEKKPAEVYKEIISEKPSLDLSNLDVKIKLVERRIDFLKNELGMNLGDEEEALKFLKARKNLLKFKDLFRWEIATFTSINNLCKKYKVKEVNFETFHRNVPSEALDELEKYLIAYKKVRDDLPVLKLIIDDGGKETKKDPILLASSPFGKWYFILGAWDKEVEIVDDLIYHGK